MKYVSTLIILFIVFAAKAQDGSRLYLNMSTGLPDNHVYNMIKDRFGYLWMTSPKGVIRYNGYSFKIFGIADGLPSEDIWLLTEDRTGRIWLSTFSKDIGYIYNEHYNKAFSNTHGLMLYPRYLYRWGNGIAFFTQYSADTTDNKTVLCTENNDTINVFTWPQIMTCVGINETPQPIVTNVSFKKWLERLPANIFIKNTCTYSKKSANRYVYYSNYGLSYSPAASNINFTNTQNCAAGMLTFTNNKGSNENVYLVYKQSGYLHVIAKNNIYLKDSSLNTISSYNINQLTGDSSIDGSRSTTLFLDSFWHTCLSTTTNGVYINYSMSSMFKKTATPNLAGYKYIGAAANGTGYWWNPSTEKLARIKSLKSIEYINNVKNANKVIPFNNDSSALLSGNGIYWLNEHTSQLTNIFNNVKLPRNSGDVEAASDALIFTNKDILASFNAVYGVTRIRIKDNVAITEKIESEQCRSITRSPSGDIICLYDLLKTVFIYNGRKTTVSTDVLKILGLKKIENIIIDQYQNIFIKDYDRILLINIPTLTCKTLLGSYVLTGAIMRLHDDMLIVAGNYGITYCSIVGSGKTGKPLLYNNIKNIYYSYIEDIQVNDSDLLMKTDKGLFTIALPRKTELENINETLFTPLFKLVINYHNKQYSTTTNDTLQIRQTDQVMQLDAINPLGCGNIKYACSFDNGTNRTELNTNEIHLPDMPAGGYCTLWVSVRDGARKSKVVAITLYTIPYWWQTVWGKRLLWLTSGILILLLAYTIVFITKRNVIKKSKKRQQLLELELKSIYSQINPHFIFNTLNSVQSSIQKNKLDTAYTQVNKFSKLLRAYMESSRNKFITIEDEISNLRNYIELQQIRFKNKFTYEILVANSNINSFLIPSLLLQPLVENAISHGLFHKDEPGHLHIEFEEGVDKNEVICRIIDNGIGRARSKQINESSLVKKGSYGSQLTKELIDIINLYEKMHIHIQYADNPDVLTGTMVEIRIKQ